MLRWSTFFCKWSLCKHLLAAICVKSNDKHVCTARRIFLQPSLAKDCTAHCANVHCCVILFFLHMQCAHNSLSLTQSMHGNKHMLCRKCLSCRNVCPRSCQSTISMSVATEPRGRTRHSRGSGGGSCRRAADAAGCVLELLEAALCATAWRLAAARRCAKATAMPWTQAALSPKRAGCVASPRCRAQSARDRTHPPVCIHCADTCVDSNHCTYY